MWGYFVALSVTAIGIFLVHAYDLIPRTEERNEISPATFYQAEELRAFIEYKARVQTLADQMPWRDGSFTDAEIGNDYWNSYPNFEIHNTVLRSGLKRTIQIWCHGHPGLIEALRHSSIQNLASFGFSADGRYAVSIRFNDTFLLPLSVPPGSVVSLVSFS